MDQKTSDIASLVEWRDEITIVPFSGIQILDFGFRLDAVDLRRAAFLECEVANNAASETVERALKPLTGDAEIDDPIQDAAGPTADHYTISHERALEPFLSKWVPVPVLREAKERGLGGDIRFDPGPSNWARLRTVELPQPEEETGHTHRVQLALDTNLIAEMQGSVYLAPLRSDAEGNRAFRFVSDAAKMDWFLRRLETDENGLVVDPQQWVSLWLDHLFMRFKAAEKGRIVEPDSLPHQFEHWARYLAYIRLIGHSVAVPRLRLANTVSMDDAVAAIPVELVLDVGNSRTCGILSERMPGATSEDIGDAFELEVRDLSRPEFVYKGLIESRVEFSIHQMGEQSFARRSGRGANFLWPSFVRVGPEAQRLVAGEEGTETASGLSSPKRYLWDKEPVMQDWRFHHHTGDMLPSSVFAALRLMNEAGDMLSQVASDYSSAERKAKPMLTQPSQRPRCSRSSLFGLMLAELFAHALVQINAPAHRAKRRESPRPRTLERIILTLPTATTSQEQAIIRSRAQGALQLVWKTLGLEDTHSKLSTMPELIVEWDEASSTQLVYLYSELTQKFGGQIDAFLKLKGRPRPMPETLRAPGEETAKPSLRLACVDIGGGTTDLMITTYWGEANRMLRPMQVFREGFRKAGDDLLERVISDLVLPQIETAITQAGGRGGREILASLFQTKGGLTQQAAQARRQFALRALMPLAIEVLNGCETAHENARLTLSVAEILKLERSDYGEGADDPHHAATSSASLARGPATAGTLGEPNATLPVELLEYLERPAQEAGASEFRLADVNIVCTREQVDAIARDVLFQPLSNMGEVIRHLGVDVLLLTGRPSRLPAVRAIIENMMVIAPHRLISMHNYKTGAWFPFRDRLSQRIGDPKSTVAVGAMLIAMSQSRIENFTVDTTAFRMRSTVRYIGRMERNGKIPEENLIFSDVDLDHKPRGKELQATVQLYGPTRIGSRQLALERWTATPLYKLDIATNAAAEKRPLTVEIEREERDDLEDDEATAAQKLAAERAREAFSIGEVTDRDNTRRKSEEVVFRLQTLGFSDDYWIDTGIFGS
ncbi:MAG: virulence factor SrfB [Pseudomonadota bacterium]